jgi:hypothetical protein
MERIAGFKPAGRLFSKRFIKIGIQFALASFLP